MGGGGEHQRENKQEKCLKKTTTLGSIFHGVGCEGQRARAAEAVKGGGVKQYTMQFNSIQPKANLEFICVRIFALSRNCFAFSDIDEQADGRRN